MCAFLANKMEEGFLTLDSECYSILIHGVGVFIIAMCMCAVGGCLGFFFTLIFPAYAMPACLSAHLTAFLVTTQPACPQVWFIFQCFIVKHNRAIVISAHRVSCVVCAENLRPCVCARAALRPRWGLGGDARDKRWKNNIACFLLQVKASGLMPDFARLLKVYFVDKEPINMLWI